MKIKKTSENLIENGQFSSLENWSRTGNVSLNQGKASLAPNASVAQTVTVKPNALIRVKYTVSDPYGSGVIGDVSMTGALIGEFVIGGGMHEFEKQLSGDITQVELKIGARAAFMLDDVELFEISEETCEPEQLLINGDFSNHLNDWQVEGNVSAVNEKASLPGPSSIQQQVKIVPGSSVQLKFNVSSYYGPGKASINGNYAHVVQINRIGAYVLDYPSDASTEDLIVHFDAQGSFHLDNIELFACRSTR